MEIQDHQSNNNYNLWSETGSSNHRTGEIFSQSGPMVGGARFNDDEESMAISLSGRDDSETAYNLETHIDRNLPGTTQFFKGLEFITKKNVQCGSWAQIEMNRSTKLALLDLG